jgi:simple sugar transport system ATP-binding protein
VLRAGRVTGEVETSETSPQQLADLMVGRKVVLSVEVPPRPADLEGTPPVFEARGLRLAGQAAHRLENVSFQVRPGEIVGIAGVEGNGQSELLQAILHPSEPECRGSGEVRVLGHDVTAWDTARIRDLGVGMIAEDRHREAILLDRPLTENFLLGLHRLPRFSRRGLIRHRELKEATRRAMDEYDVRPRRPSALAGRLSGGNQQKLVIAREFAREPKFLVAAQPTRGVDVGAIEFIHGRIVRARQGGAGVLLVSSELDEILALSDRILVMYEGRIVAEFARGQCDERQLGLRMGGVTT